MEIWKEIKGYEGFYEISSNGLVRSIHRTIKRSNGKRQTFNDRILKHTGSSAHYPKVDVYKDGIREKKYIHRLLAECFIPNPQNRNYVNHKDGDKRNYSLDNLEWVTGSENNIHAYRHGLADHKNDKHPKAQLVLNTESGVYFFTVKQAASAHCMKLTTLHGMLSGRNPNKTSLVKC